MFKLGDLIETGGETCYNAYDLIYWNIYQTRLSWLNCGFVNYYHFRQVSFVCMHYYFNSYMCIYKGKITHAI